MRFSIALYLFALFLPVFSSEKRDFKDIDAAVLGMKRARRVKKVIRVIARNSRDDWDRARGAYVWVANNIEYDVDAYLSDTLKVVEAEDVFTSGKSVCQGYAGLFTEIARGLGLQTVVIDGYAKGYGYKTGTHFKKINHSWNVVKIENKWHFIEATWGAGSFDGKKFVRNYNTIWFNTDPRLFVLNHFPKDTSWLLITPSLTLTDYEKRPFTETFFIEAFTEAGFSADEQLALFRHSPFPEFFDQYTKSFSKMGGKAFELVNYLKQGSVPSFWTYPGVYPELANYPKTGTLTSGKKYFFSFRIPRCKDAAVISGGVYTYLKRDKDIFSGEAVAKPGEVRLAVKILYEGKNSYWPLVIWQCK